MPSESAASHQPPDTASPVTLRTYILAAIAAQLPRHNGTVETEIAFLMQHLRQIADQGQSWRASLSSYLRQPQPQDRWLLGLAKSLKLTAPELLTVALAVAVETDVMVSRALARVQAPLGGSRPTLSLLVAALVNLSKTSVQTLHHLVNGQAVGSGLLQRLHPELPLPEQTIQVPLHLVFALQGKDSTVPGTQLGLPHNGTIPLATSIQQQAQRQAQALTIAGQTLALRTGSMAEGKSVACAIAQALRRRPLFIETDSTVPGLGPWLLLRHLLPVFCRQLAPGETVALPTIPGYEGPVLALANPDGSLAVADGTVLNWVLTVPSLAERQQLWTTALGNPELAADLARHHRHSSGRIAQLGALAHQYSTLAQRTAPTLADLTAAAWSGEGVGLDALAQPLTDPVREDALVLDPELQEKLQALLLRCRMRDGLVDALGVSATTRYHPGVRALFVGPSGTGKTLAASWLATQLAMPLYRVDLASVTSKYIGETEKNLAQLLARAEQAGVMLLFDEADSLFGKRTDVQQANDRFANAQTNYLLQRIETYDGVTLLTSNSRQRFDKAFARRLDTVIEFSLPRPQERLALWRSHLGEQTEVEPQDLNRLAATVDLCGGHIRNAVLMAAVLAQAEQRSITYEDVLVGVDSEYQKQGRQVPAVLSR
ncbi:MAG: ATP-binding protein [Leptolyngbya sp. SIO1E4]|nr:ATP-binding protein [Leptolyngbya sp. SIO1E4]